MPFLNIFMISFATEVRNRELARRQTRQDQIHECLQRIGTMYMREPVDPSRRQRYWDTYVGLRCLLIELAAEEVVCEFMFSWAKAYLEVMPLVQNTLETPALDRNDHIILSPTLAGIKDVHGGLLASLCSAEVLPRGAGAGFLSWYELEMPHKRAATAIDRDEPR